MLLAILSYSTFKFQHLGALSLCVVSDGFTGESDHVLSLQIRSKRSRDRVLLVVQINIVGKRCEGFSSRGRRRSVFFFSFFMSTPQYTTHRIYLQHPIILFRHPPNTLCPTEKYVSLL